MSKKSPKKEKKISVEEETPSDEGKVVGDIAVSCEVCNGTGLLDANNLCFECKGRGKK